MRNNSKLFLYLIILCCGTVIATVSLINIINPSLPKYVEYTEEEIKTKAKELGMVELKDVIKLDDDSNAEEEKISNKDQYQNSNVDDNEENTKLNDTLDSEQDVNKENKSLQQEDNDDNEEIENSAPQNNEISEEKINNEEDIENNNTQGNMTKDSDKETQKSTQEIDQEKIIFKVKKGEKSESIISRLYDLELIKDKDEFTDLVIEHKAGRDFAYGTYELYKGMDNDTILKVFTGK